MIRLKDVLIDYTRVPAYANQEPALHVASIAYTKYFTFFLSNITACAHTLCQIETKSIEVYKISSFYW